MLHLKLSEMKKRNKKTSTPTGACSKGVFKKAHILFIKQPL